MSKDITVGNNQGTGVCERVRACLCLCVCGSGGGEYR